MLGLHGHKRYPNGKARAMSTISKTTVASKGKKKILHQKEKKSEKRGYPTGKGEFQKSRSTWGGKGWGCRESPCILVIAASTTEPVVVIRLDATEVLEKGPKLPASRRFREALLDIAVRAWGLVDGHRDNISSV